MAKDSGGTTLELNDLVSLTIPTGKLGAGNETTGMIVRIQNPDNVDAEEVFVDYLVGSQGEVGDRGGTVDQVWIASSDTTFIAHYAPPD